MKNSLYSEDVKPTPEAYGVTEEEIAAWEETNRKWEEKKNAVEKKIFLFSALFTIGVATFLTAVCAGQFASLHGSARAVAVTVVFLLIGVFSYHIVNLLLKVIFESLFSALRPKSQIDIPWRKYRADQRDWQERQKEEQRDEKQKK